MQTDNYYLQIRDRLIGSDELVDAETAAAITGLASRTLRDMATRRELPIYKIGPRTTRFLVRDLVE